MENLSFSQKLEMLKQKMTELEKIHNFSFPTSFTFDGFEKYYNNAKTKKDVTTINQMDFELFSYAIDMCNFSNAPQIVPDKQYNSLSLNTNSVFAFDELYRGARNVQRHANLLFDEKRHAGIGGLCNGIYTTPSRIVAFSYTRTEDFSEKNPLIMSLKIPNATIASELELLSLMESIEHNAIELDGSVPTQIADLINFANSFGDENERAKFICALKQDISILAALLGYDCVYDRKFPSIVMLNRGKLVVSKSQAKTIQEAFANENASQLN
jgi:hypothetical protein